MCNAKRYHSRAQLPNLSLFLLFCPTRNLGRPDLRRRPLCYKPFIMGGSGLYPPLSFRVDRRDLRTPRSRRLWDPTIGDAIRLLFQFYPDRHPPGLSGQSLYPDILGNVYFHLRFPCEATACIVIGMHKTGRWCRLSGHIWAATLVSSTPINEDG